LKHVPAASLSIARWYADDVIARGPVTPQDGVVRMRTGRAWA